MGTIIKRQRTKVEVDLEFKPWQAKNAFLDWARHEEVVFDILLSEIGSMRILVPITDWEEVKSYVRTYNSTNREQ